jgi:hypothetical protein
MENGRKKFAWIAIDFRKGADLVPALVLTCGRYLRLRINPA